MYLVAVTTTDTLSGTTFAHLHPLTRRVQLSHSPERVDSHYDAALALYLAAGIFDDGGDVTARYITITGPDGPVRESYRGPADDASRLSLIARHDSALAGVRL